MVRQGSGLEIIDIANPEAPRRAVQHMKASADKQIGIGSMGEDGRTPPPTQRRRPKGQHQSQGSPHTKVTSLYRCDVAIGGGSQIFGNSLEFL